MPDIRQSDVGGQRINDIVSERRTSRVECQQANAAIEIVMSELDSVSTQDTQAEVGGDNGAIRTLDQFLHQRTPPGG